jgi:hypothetical protein
MAPSSHLNVSDMGYIHRQLERANHRRLLLDGEQTDNNGRKVRYWAKMPGCYVGIHVVESMNSTHIRAEGPWNSTDVVSQAPVGRQNTIRHDIDGPPNPDVVPRVALMLAAAVVAASVTPLQQ